MFNHVPVLLKDTIEGLNIKSDGVYVDATLGGGGHSEKILEKLELGKGYLIGIDQDEDAISFTSERLKEYIINRKLIIVKNNFENIDTILDELKIEKIDGILFDLGVSSYQFDEGSRGFSYNKDAKLDMRMDKNNPLTCERLVNEFPEEELYEIIRDFGEDMFERKDILLHNHLAAIDDVDAALRRVDALTVEVVDLCARSIELRTLNIVNAVSNVCLVEREEALGTSIAASGAFACRYGKVSLVGTIANLRAVIRVLAPVEANGVRITLCIQRQHVVLVA